MNLVDATPFIVHTDPPHLGGTTWYFVRLVTDEGHIGWGETAVLSALSGLEEGFGAMVRNIFSAHLRGEDARNPEMLYNKLYTALTVRHPDYVTMGLVSAFDTAIWDICGKHYGVPVYDLLGGRCRERIRTYTYIYDLEASGSRWAAAESWTSDPDRLAELAIGLVEEGFTALKFDPVPQQKLASGMRPPYELTLAEYAHAERAVEALRSAIGDRADILIGTHGQITPSAARRLAARLERFDPLWLEEPCPPENYVEMGRIARSTTIPIASGERLVTPYEFQSLFAEGACAFAQPDLGSCGGITACKKIASIAEANYVLMAPHVWGGPVITAAALQIDAHVPNFLIQESIHQSRGFFDAIVKSPFEWVDGDLIVPRTAGIGVELDESALTRIG